MFSLDLPCDVDQNQEKNGGVLYVSEGTTATFLGASEFTGNSIMTRSCETTTECSQYEYVVKKGGAIHNKVSLDITLRSTGIITLLEALYQ